MSVRRGIVGPSEEAVPTVSNWKILIVEDDCQVRELLTLVLEEQGYRVRTLTSGAHVLETVREFAPDLITLDLGLPDVDGQTVLNQLWSDATTREVPVIVVSALTAELRRTPQVRDVVGKPFDVDHLIEAVASSLGAS